MAAVTQVPPRSSLRRALLFALALSFVVPAGARAQEADPEANPEANGAAAGETPEEEAAEDAQLMMTDESAIDDQAAREFFTSGSNLYELGRYHDAAIQFQQAYDLSSRPALLYNIYLAHRDASEQRQAAEALRLYLEQTPDAENHAALSVRLGNLDRAIAEQEDAEDTAAREAEEAILREQAEQARREAEERAIAEDNRKIIPWIIVGSGAAIMAVGAVTGIIALGLASSLDSSCIDAGDGTSVCPDQPDLRDKQSTLSAFATTTDILLIGGGIIAAAGLTWALIQMTGGSDDDPDAPAVSAMCGPTGCGASMRMGF